MTTLLARGARMLGGFSARLTVRRDNGPIGTVDELQRFVTSRAAFVAQHKLYGYLKTRIGTRYPRMFEDEVFVRSVNAAKMHVFAACLSDLAIHATARVAFGAGWERAASEGLALGLYRGGLAGYSADAPEPGDAAMWNAAFAARLDRVNWENGGADAFTVSPGALLRWAPIADELKRYDAEIVRNSVRYAWNEVIRALRLRLDAGAIRAELQKAT